MIDFVRNGAELLLLLSGVGTAVVAWVKLVQPKLRQRHAARAAAAKRQADANQVLLGADPVPANPITGAPAKGAIPAIGKQMVDLREVVDALAVMLEQVRHEVHPNNGSSMKDAVSRTEAAVAEITARLADGDRRFDEQGQRLGRIETVLADELRVATDTVANAAEASKTGLAVIQAAFLADPPADL